MIPKSVAAAILFIFLIVALLIITMIWVGRKTQQCAKREASNRDLSSFAMADVEREPPPAYTKESRYPAGG
ncbi:hypothetical protein AX14_001162 [Amanita brunnescens Koide BX004]|nr:hypothetical protein AX14_001162 [Amanita brunnescens Koide BX004]